MKDFSHIHMDHIADIKDNPVGPGFSKDNNLNLFNTRSTNVIKYRFDFDIGYLIQSPCRDCQSDSRLPYCANDCVILEKIQTILAESISCTSRL